MNFKINFQGMEHSLALENYATKKAEKLMEFLQKEQTPPGFEFHLVCHPNHAHQEVTLHLRAKHFKLNTTAEGTDSYVVLDVAVDKMITLIKKEKEKIRDAHRKAPSEKHNYE
jgi:ribosomal subunit interface protein